MRRRNSLGLRRAFGPSLKTRLFVVLVLVVSVVTVLFAAIDYIQEKRTLQALHQYLQQSGPASPGTSPNQEHEQHLTFIRSALTRTGVTHLIHWSATVLVLVAALQWQVNKTIIKPLQDVMDRLNVMQLGTWPPALEVNSADEIGLLAQKVEEVGKTMSQRVDEWRGVERLSTLALLSGSIENELRRVTGELRKTAQTIRAKGNLESGVGSSSVPSDLEAQAGRLEALEGALHERFSRALENVRASKSAREAV